MPSAPRDELQSYLSPLTVERLWIDTQSSDERLASEFRGVILLLDITGFTKLTEHLDSGGPDGAERLSNVLNHYFSLVINTVAGHGGLIAKFLGDAVLAVWPAYGGHDDPLNWHPAARCALSLLERLRSDEHANPSRLTVKAAFSAGQIVHGLFGRDESWISVLGGQAMCDARHALTHCQPGELLGFGIEVEAKDAHGICRIVSADQIDASQDLFAIERHPAPPPSAAWQAKLLPAAIRDLHRAGLSAWLAEFRQVTIIFLHVRDADFRSPDDAEHIQRICETVQLQIHALGGVVDGLGEDHDGLAFKIVFGVPGASHEDDAWRALRACEATRASLAEMGMPVTAGITTGRLFFGSAGTEQVRAYLTVGDAVNRSARLMQLAGDRVVCDEATAAACATRLHFERLDAVRLRGKSVPVPIFQPLFDVRDQPVSREIIGRAREKALIALRIEDFRTEPRGGLLLLEGEPGIGKSSMLSYVTDLCESTALTCVRGSADALDTHTPYVAWRSIFDQILDLATDDRAPNKRARAQAWTTRCNIDPRMLDLLNPVLDTGHPESSYSSSLPSQTRAEQTISLMIEMLHERAASDRFVIVLEDIHWMDSASVALLLAASRHIDNILFIATLRPSASFDEHFPGLASAPNTTRLALGAMTAEDVHALACRQMGAAYLAPELQAFIEKNSDGNPLFCEELSRALRDGGLLAWDDGGCRLRATVGLHRLQLAGTVQSVIGSRMDNLAPRARLLLKVASIHGDRFDFNALSYICPPEFDEHSLRMSLQELVSREFISSDNRQHTFAFKHAVVQEVAYQQLPYVQRRQLHKRMAGWFEQVRPHDTGLIAHHWFNAEVADKAAHFLDLAGQSASQRFANREADELFSRALTLADDRSVAVPSVQRGKWLRLRGEARFHLGHIQDSRADFHNAMRTLGWRIPVSWRIPMLDLPVAAIMQLSGASRAYFPCTAAQKAGIEETLATLQMLGEVAYFESDIWSSAYYVFRSANLAGATRNDSLAIAPYCGVMLIAGTISRKLGEAYLSRASVIAEQCGTQLQQAYVCLIGAIFLSGFGAWSRVSDFLQKGLTVYRQFSYGRRIEESLLMGIYALFYQGRFAESEPYLLELERSARRRGDTQTTAWGKLLRAQVALNTAGPSAALEALGSDFDSGTDDMTRTASRATAAAACLRLGRLRDARVFGAEALHRSLRSPPRAHTMMLYTAYLAEVFVTLSLTANEASHSDGLLARQACKSLHSFARMFPIAHPSSAIWSGAFSFSQGNWSRARKQWLRAAHVASELGMTMDALRAHGLLACEQETVADFLRGEFARHSSHDYAQVPKASH